MDFFLKFTLISYAAIVFFVIGWRLSFFYKANSLKWIHPAALFVLTAFSLSLAFLQESFRNRFIISAIWTSVLWSGFRFGKKITKMIFK